MFDNMKEQREKVFTDEDLMFSFRDGHYGDRIDDDSLLVQLYTRGKVQVGCPRHLGT